MVSWIWDRYGNWSWQYFSQSSRINFSDRIPSDISVSVDPTAQPNPITLYVPPDVGRVIPIVVVNRSPRHGFVVTEGIFSRRLIALRARNEDTPPLIPIFCLDAHFWPRAAIRQGKLLAVWRPAAGAAKGAKCDSCLTRVYPALKTVSSIFVRGAEHSALLPWPAVSRGARQITRRAFDAQPTRRPGRPT